MEEEQQVSAKVSSSSAGPRTSRLTNPSPNSRITQIVESNVKKEKEISLHSGTKRTMKGELSKLRPKTRMIHPVESIYQPENETPLHYKTKQHLSRELNKTRTISILKTCSTRCNVDAPANWPYWSCTNTKKEENWISGWNEAVPEAKIDKTNGMRADVGLLDVNGNVVGVVEVLLSSPMTIKKLEDLSSRSIKWLEVKADINFFRSKNLSFSSLKHPQPPPPWSHNLPLPVIATSDGPWICETCQQTSPETISFEKILSIVDVYSSSTSKNGKAQIKRKVFAIFHQYQPKIWYQPDKSTTIDRFFLVEGSLLLSVGRLSMDSLPRESLLLATYDRLPSDLPTDLGPSTYNQLPSNFIPPQFHDAIKKELEKELSYDAGAMMDVRLEWPGSSISEFFKAVDPMGSLVSTSGIKSIGKLHASLTRVIGLRYRYDVSSGRWIPSRNFKQRSVSL